jgi:hypothetical protein
MITTFKWRGKLLARLQPEMLLIPCNHLFDILPGSNTKDAIAVTDKIHSKMEHDRPTSTLELEVVLGLDAIGNLQTDCC